MLLYSMLAPGPVPYPAITSAARVHRCVILPCRPPASPAPKPLIRLTSTSVVAVC
jgi:hypothetical protein